MYVASNYAYSRGVAGGGGGTGGTCPPFFPERQGKALYFRTLIVISVVKVVLRAGKDDRKAVYKPNSFQTSHRANVLLRNESEGHVN